MGGWLGALGGGVGVSRKVCFISIALHGHAMPLAWMAEEMQRRGHKVTFATHDSGREWANQVGVEFLSAGPFPIPKDEYMAKMRRIAQEPSTFRGILNIFNEIYLPMARPLFQNLHGHLAKDPPDLIVMDIGTMGARDLAHSLDVPFVVNSPTLLFNLAMDHNANPSFVPAWGSGLSSDMTLWERCMNLLFPRLLSVALTPPFMHINKVRRARTRVGGGREAGPRARVGVGASDASSPPNRSLNTASNTASNTTLVTTLQMRWELQLPLFESQEDILGKVCSWLGGVLITYRRPASTFHPLFIHFLKIVIFVTLLLSYRPQPQGPRLGQLRVRLRLPSRALPTHNDDGSVDSVERREQHEALPPAAVD